MENITDSNNHSILNTFGGVDRNSLITALNIDDCEISSDDIPELSQSHYYTYDEFENILDKHGNNISILSLNCQSLRAKIDALRIFLDSSTQVDVVLLQETWLGPSDDINHLNIENYQLISKPKRLSSHGGLAIYLHNKFTFKELRLDSTDASNIYESQFIDISIATCVDTRNITIGNIYRPPRDLITNYEKFEEEFSSVISHLSAIRRNVVIGGDYNINLLEVNNRPTFKTFLDSIFSNGYFPAITLPTRLSTCCTLIDNYYCKVTTESLNSTSGIIISNLSDHLPYFITFNVNMVNNVRSKYINKRFETPLGIAKIRNELSSLNLCQEIDNNQSGNPYESYGILLNAVKGAMDKHIPLKKIKVSHYTHNKNPWCTDAILHQIKYRDKLYKKLKSTSPNSPRYMGLKTNLKTCNKILKSEIRHAKSVYYKEYFEQFKSDTSKTWKKINEILGNKKVMSTNNTFKKGERILNNSTEIANEFNNFFANVSFSNNEAEIGLPNFSQYLHNHVTSTFSFSLVSDKDIEDACNLLEGKISVGHDGMSTAFLKKIIDILKQPLALIFNQCITTGIFPSQLKLSKIIPLYKKCDPEQFDNYRPIALLPGISKIFEKVMHIQIYSYFVSNDLFFGAQYGFRKCHSTEFAALHLTSEISRMLDDKKTPFSIYLDLSKAFDLIDPQILLDKLKHYGFSALSLSLCKSYLSDRKQYVSYSDAVSDTITIFKGVPQGSIIGPLFFLIFINDLYLSSSRMNFILFADDTTIFSSLQDFDPHNTGDINIISSEINNELNLIHQWILANKLKINATKTKFMCFRTRQQRIVYPELYLGHDKIENVNSFNFLGIHVDEFLSWKVHIDVLSTKLSRTIGIMARMKNMLPCYVLRIIYFSLFASHLTYGILLWGYANDKISKLQKRAVRLICNAKYNAHTEPLLKQMAILKFKDILSLLEYKFYYKYANNSLPEHMQYLITPYVRHHSINTRTNWILQPVVTRLVSLTACLRCNIVITINNAPKSILDKVSTHSLDGFSNYVKNIIISSYSLYCDLPNCYVCNQEINQN